MGSIKKFDLLLIVGKKKFSLKMREDETILEAALQAGIELPYTCLQGWCITCASKLIEGKVDQSRALRIYPEDKKEGFVLICSAFPKSNLKIRTHQKEALRRLRISKNLPVPHG